METQQEFLMQVGEVEVFATAEAQQNSIQIFFLRVRLDNERGYAPAGQVYPPPQPIVKPAKINA